MYFLLADITYCKLISTLLYTSFIHRTTAVDKIQRFWGVAKGRYINFLNNNNNKTKNTTKQMIYIYSYNLTITITPYMS